MNALAIALLVLFTAGITCSAGWMRYHYPEKSSYPGMEAIHYSADKSKGASTFFLAIQHLEELGLEENLKTVTLHPLLRETDFQRELFELMMRRNPKLLQEALDLPNHARGPKVTGLKKFFMEIVLETKEVKKIASDLAQRNLRIKRVSGEKFRLITSDDRSQFLSSLVLVIEAQKPIKTTE